MLWWPFASRSLTMGQGKGIEFQTGAILAAALALLVLPLSLLLSFLMAAFFHELCHYLALRWTGTRVYRITIGPFGAAMETDAMDPGREVICALAGPLGSLLLAGCYRICPEIAICALVQGCFNLLPLYPSDGGRILSGTLEMLGVPGRTTVCLWIRRITGSAICCLCLYGFRVWKLGYGVLLLGALTLLRTFPRKTPCKEAFFGVQ